MNLKKTFFLLFFCVVCLNAYPVKVKFENASLKLDAVNSEGQGVISATSDLSVKGIRGEEFDLVILVKDGLGKWHTDDKGRPVKLHRKMKADTDRYELSRVEISIPYDKLYPKPGTENYDICLYVYYGGEYYGGTKAGSYSLIGATYQDEAYIVTSDLDTSEIRNLASRKDIIMTEHQVECADCAGVRYCLTCQGSGLQKFGFAESMSCPTCGGRGVCLRCKGVGMTRQISVHNRTTGLSIDYDDRGKPIN